MKKLFNMIFLRNLVLFLIFLLIFVVLLFKFTNLKDHSSINNQNIKYLKSKLHPNIIILLQMLSNSERLKNKINNDYNTLFFPETQLMEVKFEKIDISKNFKKKMEYAGYKENLKKLVRQKFYLKQYKNNILILNTSGSLFYTSLDKINDAKLNKIKTNLKLDKTLDLFVDNNTIFISGIKIQGDCDILHVVKSQDLKLEEISFTTIFKSSECVKKIQSGKIRKLYDYKKNSILLATAADILPLKDKQDPKPQNNDSIYGKILEIDINTKKFSNFTKGHRNILGFYTDEEIMLATEMGPRGGDEINKIEFSQNYGWPISSYGTNYDYKLSDNKLSYKSSHEDFGYQEPIFNFFSSVGISQIIKIGDNFSDKWKDSFLVASLNGKHLYRIKFNKVFDKVIYIESIFTDERVRDIIYVKEKKLFIMALEETGSLGIIKIIN